MMIWLMINDLQIMKRLKTKKNNDWLEVNLRSTVDFRVFDQAQESGDNFVRFLFMGEHMHIVLALKLIYHVLILIIKSREFFFCWLLVH